MVAVNLGIYIFGLGVKEDRNRAMELYIKGCDEGDLRMCRTLGLMYYNGFDVYKNNFKTIEFYTKACKGGLYLCML